VFSASNLLKEKNRLCSILAGNTRREINVVHLIYYHIRLHTMPCAHWYADQSHGPAVCQNKDGGGNKRWSAGASVCVGG
jgi:hypothetical protein